MRKILSQSSLQVLHIFCLLFLIGCKEEVIMENDEPTPTDSISVLLNVAVINGREVIVEAVFCNKLDVMVGIEKRRILYNNMMEWGAFRVVRGNEEIHYIGRKVHYLEEFENKENLYNLMPGGSFTARIKLHKEYDLSRSGTYIVTYEGFWWLPDEKGNDDLFFVRSNTVEFKLEERHYAYPAYQ